MQNYRVKSGIHSYKIITSGGVRNCASNVCKFDAEVGNFKTISDNIPVESNDL
jgi:hypothetical protein